METGSTSLSEMHNAKAKLNTRTRHLLELGSCGFEFGIRRRFLLIGGTRNVAAVLHQQAQDLINGSSTMASMA